MLHAMSRFFVTLVQKYLPDAYLFAIILTFISFIGALALTGKGFMAIITMWGNGLWGILAFAMQMILILVTGHALASSKPVKSFLTMLASIPSNGGQAAMMNCFAVGVASFVAGDSHEALFERADRALYRAKRGGRNQVRS